ncbi:uncharacterized protein MEPE_05697 [Melanopsichium pennsylvanicum]|uniref:Vps72/YL1 C-terminal domain-containing protein n=2 Tax=Melanopsichium pennsylvanicum TaxID=63383 RepID=A0AAJ4XRJ3_9BASI|nr:uncharacterized protein MEPE_05697 [Melanopsichium pennsylvanicum]
MTKMSSNLSRRNKSLKQILQAEREAAMRAAGQKFKERKNKEGEKKGRLVGAALQAVARREERERLAKEEAAKSETPVAHEEIKAEGDGKGDLEIKAEETAQKAESGEKEEEDPGAPKRDIPSYSSVEAPPSLRPAKKYCDVTGLIAPYTDPKSGLRYHSVEVYEIIKQFGPGVDNAYLSLRGDGSQIK